MAILIGTKKSKWAFLGEGIEYPFKLQFVNDYIQGTSVKDSKYFKKVRMAIWMLIDTRLGERVMLPNYGCRLHELCFEPVPIVKLLGPRMVQEALDAWEPRVNINSIVTEELKSKETTVILFHINYQIIRANVPDNLVYPFYLQAA